MVGDYDIGHVSMTFGLNHPCESLLSLTPRKATLDAGQSEQWVCACWQHLCVKTPALATLFAQPFSCPPFQAGTSQAECRGP